MPSGSEAGKGTYERVGALAEKLDDAGRQELAALVTELIQEWPVGIWERRGAKRWLRDAGWLER